MEPLRVEIASLSLVPSGGGTCAIVLREVNGFRFLPVVIGLLEAQAIAVKIQGMPVPRPLTHDLLNALMLEFKGKLLRVVIDRVRESTFYATMEIDHDGRTFRIDSRPSDAIALAVRTQTPIFVTEEVMDAAGATPDNIPSMEINVGNAPPFKPSSKSPQGAPTSAPARHLSPVEELEAQMKAAIKNEDYERAAYLRDKIQSLKNKHGDETSN
jgi:hypothetical protein